jgi:vanillate O-demethylase ferredoxin subunit
MTSFEPRWTNAVVRAISEPAAGVRAFDLVPSDGVASYPLGSHIQVRVPLGARAEIRHYSLVGERAREGAYRIAVKYLGDGRGGSRYLWSLEPGATLQISEPKSHFELRAGASEYLLIAGGIGITPLVGMADSLAARGARFRLLYAGRSRREMAFLPVLTERLGDRLGVFAGAEGRRLDLNRELSALPPEAEVYLCGPIALMEAARRVWRTLQREPGRLRIETFGSSGHRPANAFAVRVIDHGTELQVARDQSLLAALSSAGIEVPGHCLRGECGLCAVRVIGLEGEIDHRDVVLSDEEKAEGRSLCSCVSRALGSIAIDTGYRQQL